MKTSLFKYSFWLSLIIILANCSTKKDKFANRNFQALNTKYNVLYNGELALEKGISELKDAHYDNYWETLPVERMLEKPEEEKRDLKKAGEGVRNPNFDRAEDKAVKAIQKRSMNIGGRERNYQIDEAHMLLGRARYYEHRYIPALEAFNYILYKYPNSNKIYEAKIWREKTNIRLENEALAIQNLTKLLNEIPFKDQVFADANASLAQAYINEEQIDPAIKSLKLATEFTKEKEEKARYRFILGQLYEKKNIPDSALAYYQSVIDMKRKSPRVYVINSHARQIAYFDPAKGDTIPFLEKFYELIEDRENRPYLDVLYHQMALYYERQEKDNQAVFFYNKSLRNKSRDEYMIASNYRNIAEIHFNNALYKKAGQYYDSTLTVLKERTREYRLIRKKRENLEDVIRYEAIAQANDSILKVVAMDEENRNQYYQTYIDKLKEEEERQKIIEKNREKSEVDTGFGSDMVDPRGGAGMLLDRDGAVSKSDPSSKGQSAGGGASNFYFYNVSTVGFGKREFARMWGNRPLKDNWRLSESQSKITFGEEDPEEEEDLLAEEEGKSKKKAPGEKPEHTVAYYLNKLPKTEKELDSIVKERDFAYYQLGLIYKEKFKEYELASGKLESLLANKPEERLVLPTMYYLYQIYQITDPARAALMKDRIVKEYPDSRYAQILTNQNLKDFLIENDPEAVYARLYKLHEEGEYRVVMDQITGAIDNLMGEEIVPKLEMLKAGNQGKIEGIEAYKRGLNYVALTYPNSPEGKEAEELLQQQIPVLENMAFDQKLPTSWKFIFRPEEMSKAKSEALREKLERFIKERTVERLKLTTDLYTENEDIWVIHGFQTESSANNSLTILRDFKDFEIKEPVIVISNENYKVVQIKKNLNDYINFQKP